MLCSSSRWISRALSAVSPPSSSAADASASRLSNASLKGAARGHVPHLIHPFLQLAVRELLTVLALLLLKGEIAALVVNERLLVLELQLLLRARVRGQARALRARA